MKKKSDIVENHFVLKTIKNYVGGAFVRSESGRSYALYDGHQRKIAQAPWSSRKDLRNAVEKAESSHSGWSGHSAFLRSQILYRLAEMMQSRQIELIDALSDLELESQPLLYEQLIEATVYYSGFCDKYEAILSSVNPVSGPHHNVTYCDAVGIVGVIGVGEHDFLAFWDSVMAALCSGNSVVAVLPEKWSSLVSLLGELFNNSDFPNGSINLLCSQKDELLPVMASHRGLPSMEIVSRAQSSESKEFEEASRLGAEHMKRVHFKGKSTNSLESVKRFLEFKTVWHPTKI